MDVCVFIHVTHTHIHTHNPFLFFFWPCHAACKIFLPEPGIEPMPLVMAAQSLNHQATREVPVYIYFLTLSVKRAQKPWHPSSKCTHLAHRSWFPNIFSIKKKEGSLEKWLTLGFLRWTWGTLLCQNIKENTQGMTGLCQKDHRNQFEPVPIGPI